MRLLDAAQEAEVQRLICRHTPDELDLPFALWSRMAVRAVIWQRCGIALAVRTVGKYLAVQGYRRLSVRPRHPKADPEAQEAFSAFFEKRAPDFSPFS